MTTEYPAWLFRMADVLEMAGAPLWLVGGAVRNALMGLPISDVDVCGPTLPEDMRALCVGTQVRAHMRAAHFGTVELHVMDEQGQSHMAEYTTFREDSYRIGHHPSKVRFTTELSVDALRRDFSVNALYQRITKGAAREIVDPTGGLVHLEQHVLHTVTEDPNQVLKDDGLRILRAVRFQAELGLMPTESLLESAAMHVPLLADIAPERLRDECEKILRADERYPTLARKAPATQTGLRTLHTVGAWPYLFKGLPYDEQAICAMGGLQTPEDISPVAGRLALLFWQAHEDVIRGDLHFLRFAAKDIQQAAACVHLMQRLLHGAVATFEAIRMGIPIIGFAQNALEAVGESAAAEKAAALYRTLSQKTVPRSLRELSVSGDDLLPLLGGRPRRDMGALLLWLWEGAVEQRLPNEREALVKAAHKWLAMESGMCAHGAMEESASLQQEPTVL